MIREPQPLIVVLGATGAGKSDLGIRLAARFGGEIVNCDSVQVYRGLDLGSAKSRISERQGVQHWLLDILDLSEELTAGFYARLAREAIATIHAGGRVPVVVGGTGFYLRALLDGLSPAPGRDEPLRRRLAKTAGRQPRALHRFLRRHDPEAALRIHPNDCQKVIRAIELTILARQPATRTQSAPRNALQDVAVLKLGLAPARDRLYERLNERSAWMFAHGLLEETKALLESGYSADTKPLQSLGYKQAVQVLAGKLSVEEAVRECQTKTRQYAKRQLTWFRAEQGVEWLCGFGGEEAVCAAAMQRVQEFLLQLHNGTKSEIVRSDE